MWLFLSRSSFVLLSFFSPSPPFHSFPLLFLLQSLQQRLVCHLNLLTATGFGCLPAASLLPLLLFAPFSERTFLTTASAIDFDPFATITTTTSILVFVTAKKKKTVVLSHCNGIHPFKSCARAATQQDQKSLLSLLSAVLRSSFFVCCSGFRCPSIFSATFSCSLFDRLFYSWSRHRRLSSPPPPYRSLGHWVTARLDFVAAAATCFVITAIIITTTVAVSGHRLRRSFLFRLCLTQRPAWITPVCVWPSSVTRAYVIVCVCVCEWFVRVRHPDSFRLSFLLFQCFPSTSDLCRYFVSSRLSEQVVCCTSWFHHLHTHTRAYTACLLFLVCCHLIPTDFFLLF